MTVSVYDELFKHEEKPTFIPEGIKIYPVPSSTLDMVLTEKVDFKLLDHCMESEQVQRMIIRNDNMKPYPIVDCLAKLRKATKKGELKVRYTRKIRYGRVYPSMSLGMLPKPLRHKLLKDDWVDIDMENAQMSILKQFCDKLDILTPSLDRYVNEREKCFEDVAKTYKFNNGKKLDIVEDRDVIKRLFILFIFYGSFDVWKKEHNIHHSCQIQDLTYLVQLKTELITIARGILIHNKEFVDEIVEPKKENKLGSAMSIFLQEYERRILDVMYSYLKPMSKYIILSFDGIMIYRPPSTLKIEDIEKEILDTTGYKIKLCIKPMDRADEIVLPTYTIPEEDLKKFNKETLSHIPGFSLKKEYFERFFTKIRNPTVFLQKHYNENGDVECYMYPSKNNFKEAFSDIPFSKEWIEDEDIDVSFTLSFLPCNKTQMEMLEEKHHGNLFTGYNDCIREDLGYDEEGMNRWLDIVLNLCGNNVEYRDYYIKLLAKQILDPQNGGKKQGVITVMLGDQGIGKNAHLEPIKLIIGKRHYQTSSDADHYFSNHAEGFVNKIIVNMDEVEFKQTKDIEGKLKARATEVVQTVNPKNIRPYTIEDYSLVIMTSNKPNPIKIDVASGDRRFFIVRGTRKYKGDINFWIETSAMFKTKKFLSSLYKYMSSIDLTNFNAERDRPITREHTNLSSVNMTPEVMFFENMFQKEIRDRKLPEDISPEAYKVAETSVLQEQRKMVGSIMCVRYNEFLHLNNLNGDKDVSPRSFYNKLRALQIDGLNEYINPHGRVLEFNFTLEKVLKDLSRRGLSSLI